MRGVSALNVEAMGMFSKRGEDHVRGATETAMAAWLPNADVTSDVHASSEMLPDEFSPAQPPRPQVYIYIYIYMCVCVCVYVYVYMI